jgi:ketosteroid isomerase-like protein
MRIATSFTLAATAALALCGCDHKGWRNHHHPDPAKIAQDIKAQETQWQKDYADKNLNALAAHYAPDAALADVGSPVATSDSDRRKELGQLISDPNLNLTFAADRVQVARSGDLAYSRGHFTIRMTDKTTNKPSTSNGSYLTVWQKQPDDSWKAVEDFITPGPAAAPAAPAAAK